MAVGEGRRGPHTRFDCNSWLAGPPNEAPPLATPQKGIEGMMCFRLVQGWGLAWGVHPCSWGGTQVARWPRSVLWLPWHALQHRRPKGHQRGMWHGWGEPRRGVLRVLAPQPAAAAGWCVVHGPVYLTALY
jgi:hypothetical protein